MYTLGTAAKAAGVSKSTIHRAIKRGTISARSKDGNSYEIDPAELHRVFPPVSQPDTGNGSEKGSAERYATPAQTGGNGGVPDPELAIRLARAEAELDALKQIVEIERRRAEEIRAERDRWAGIAEASQRQITDLSAKVREPRSWWPFGRRA